MKKIIPITIILIVAVVMVAFGYFQAGGDEENLQPKIAVEPTEYDFGAISAHEKSEYDFIIKNIGSLPLEIQRVSTSCACTTAEIERQVIPVGSKANLHVVYDPTLMPPLGDDILRMIYIKSNDPTNPEVEIEIKAKIIR